jgi:transposase
VSEKKTPNIELTNDDLTGLKQRIQASNLNPDDVGTIFSILELIISLKTLLKRKKAGILRLLRQIFGFKTEKETQKGRPKSSSAAKNLLGKRGRNGRDDYPSAKKISVPHPELKPGDECPDCHKGKLKEDKPCVDYDWQGNAPISLDIYLLQRLLCPICKISFIAPSPVANSAKTVDDSEDEVKVARCDRNAYANSIVASLRFMFGVPHYRLEKIQGSLGIALPSSTQYKMLYQVYLAGVLIYEYLIFLAAQGGLFHSDDTSMKILDWLGGNGPRTKVTKQPRMKAYTSAIISKSTEGKDIILYLTGENQAGKNMAKILKKRKDGYEAPIYMADGLAANNPGEEFILIKVNCLDHARRKFDELLMIYPKKCQYVIDQLALVYKADKEAKEMVLSPQDRMVYHQKHSQAVMDDLGKWMMEQIQSKKVEENSELGGAIKYCLNRWSELTEFLYTPGVPLSNSEAERAIKKIITHRKNSLFYKTEKGAHVGDVIQSLIATCEAANINIFKYLAWIQENKSKVKADPGKFLPWNFQEAK